MVTSDHVIMNAGTLAAQAADVFRRPEPGAIGPARFRVLGRSTTRAPKPRFAEAFRMLALQTIHPADGSNLKAILVMGAYRGEGRTTVAANLSIALAETGRRVALVDADVRQPGLARFFPAIGGAGSTPLLPPAGGQGGSGSALVVAPTDVAGVALVQQRAGGAEPMRISNVDQVLDVLRPAVDSIVIDTPPCMSYSDAFFLAPKVDAVLFVVRRRRQDATAQRGIQQQLSALGARVLGVVYNES